MSPTVTYRSATTADVEEIIRLWGGVGLGGDEDDYNRNEALTRLAADDGFFVVGEIASGVLGAVAMGCYDNHRGWVKRVAVAPELQGGGVGRSLIAELERRFLAAGIDQLRLSVWADNTQGGAFWESLDYVELPDIRYFTKDLS